MKLRFKLRDLVFELGAVFSALPKLELLVHDGLFAKVEITSKVLGCGASTITDC